MTIPPQIRQLAQQGDPQAIAALLNRSLEPQDVQTQVERDGDQLNIYLFSAAAPSEMLGKRIELGLKRLQIANIRRCNIRAFQAGSERPLWKESLSFVEREPAMEPRSAPVTIHAQPVPQAEPGPTPTPSPVQSSVKQPSGSAIHDILALLPLRTLGFACLLVGLISPVPYVVGRLLDWGPDAQVRGVTLLAIAGSSLLLAQPLFLSLFLLPEGRDRLFQKAMSATRSVIVLSYFTSLIASAFFGGEGLGIRLRAAIQRLDFGNAWAPMSQAILIALAIDLTLGGVQIFIPKLRRKSSH